MRQRVRKLIGAVLILGWTVVFSLAAAMVGGLTLADASSAAQLLYCLVAALVWTGPAALLIDWMQRPDAPAL
jgi:Protein of unknown function (DUF2842)